MFLSCLPCRIEHYQRLATVSKSDAVAKRRCRPKAQKEASATKPLQLLALPSVVTNSLGLPALSAEPVLPAVHAAVLPTSAPRAWSPPEFPMAEDYFFFKGVYSFGIVFGRRAPKESGTCGLLKPFVADHHVNF